MTSLNDPTMESSLGQSVLNDKDVLSYDCEKPFGQNVSMAEIPSETEETLAYIIRVRSARLAKFSGQKPVYSYLGIDQDQYKHYELTTSKPLRPMPRRYIPKFCTITEVSFKWLLTGEGEGPPLITEERPAAKRRSARSTKGRQSRLAE